MLFAKLDKTFNFIQTAVAILFVVHYVICSFWGVYFLFSGENLLCFVLEQVN